MQVIPELVDGCNLRCILCWNRNRRGTFKQMSLATVEQVLKVWGRRPQYCWYNWGEPLLYKNFCEFVDMTRRYRSCISSNFSLHIPDSHFEAMKNLAQVTVSMSGLTAEVYNIYHQGGNFPLVWENVNRLKGYHNIRINWLKHPGNAHQEEECKKWCQDMGFIYGGFRANCEVEECLEDFTHPFLKTERHYSSKHFKNCKVQRWMPISVDGEYLICCTTHNIGLGVTVWDNITYDQLLELKRNHPFCKKCFEKGCWRMF